MVVVDATMLLLLLNPHAKPPTGPDGKRIPLAKRRIEHLIAELNRSKSRLVVPAPALSEALVRLSSTQAQQAVEYINGVSVFRIEPFDQRAAIEMAEMMRIESAQVRSRAREGGPETWAKIKFDRQIVAISRVVGAKLIYSDDGDIKSLGERMGMDVKGVGDLPVPPADLQTSLIARLHGGTEETDD